MFEIIIVVYDFVYGKNLRGVFGDSKKNWSEVKYFVTYY